MDLAEFVQTTLEQIIRGVSEAQRVAGETGARVNSPGDARVQPVEFDVVVTAREGSGSEAGLRVGLPGIGAGLGGNSDRSHAAENRVRFTVLVRLPVQD